MKTIAFEKVGDTVILVHSAQNPSDEDWQCWIEYINRTGCQRFLIDSVGGIPTKSQRDSLSSLAFLSKNPTTVLLTSSSLVLLALTAINVMINTTIKPFRSTALEAALDYIKVPEEERTLIKETRLQMRASFF